MSDTKLEPPKRRIELKLEIGADDLPACLRLLDYLRRKIAQGDLTCLSGGMESGGRFQVEHHEGQTHEKWYADLEAYLKQLERDVPVKPNCG